MISDWRHHLGIFGPKREMEYVGGRGELKKGWLRQAKVYSTRQNMVCEPTTDDNHTSKHPKCAIILIIQAHSLNASDDFTQMKVTLPIIDCPSCNPLSQEERWPTLSRLFGLHPPLGIPILQADLIVQVHFMYARLFEGASASAAATANLQLGRSKHCKTNVQLSHRNDLQTPLSERTQETLEG